MYQTISKYAFVSLLLLFLFSNTYGQKEQFEGNTHYENKDYSAAIPLYVKSLKYDYNGEVLEKLAYCYYQTGDFINAVEYYKKAIDEKSYTPNSVYYYAESLQKNEQFDEAIVQFETLKKIQPDLKEKMDAKISSCLQAKKWKEEYKNNVIIENVKPLNSPYQEAGIFLGNNQIYFSSSRLIKTMKDEVNVKKIEVNHFRLFSAKIANPNDLRSIKSPYMFNIAKFNDEEDIAHPSLNSNENVCYFSSSYSYSFGNKKFHNHQEETFTEIFILESVKTNNGWSEPKSIFNKDLTNYKMLHPCLSKNGTRLYFVSDMSGGYGSYDIYFTDKNANGEWSKPVNLGSIVNSKGRELYPSYADDTVLYFSSDGHIGMGGLDIYKATMVDGKVNAIENMKYPINSSRNDHSLVPTPYHTTGYFCSNRPGGLGSDDIYYFRVQR